MHPPKPTMPRRLKSFPKLNDLVQSADSSQVEDMAPPGDSQSDQRAPAGRGFGPEAGTEPTGLTASITAEE